MAHEYLPVDRDQLFLLPPSMREWLPEDHLVWFVLEVVERVDTSVLHARHPRGGVGRRAYDPDMLLALLIYAYCSGIRSSRQIERLCVVDVGFRVLTGGHVPDHTTIARFRQGHRDVAQRLFCDVLVLCAEAGMARVGVVAVDGTKISADASMKANRTLQQIEAEVAAIFDAAAATDDAEDSLFGSERGDELPEELADPSRRSARLDAALESLAKRRRERDAEAEAAAAAQREAWENRKTAAEAEGMSRPRGRPQGAAEVEAAEEALAAALAKATEQARRRAEREAEAAAEGRSMRGPTPREPADSYPVRQARDRVAKAKARAEARAERTATPGDDRVNVTDPDSRMMKTTGGWVQGYNAQAAVTEDGVVIAADVTQDVNDCGQCVPMMAATRTNLDTAGITDDIGTVLFDAGYLSDDNLTAEGPDRLIATAKAYKLRKSEPTEGPPPPDAAPVAAMTHRLRTQEGAALYAKRQHTVEPVFGDIKHLRGFRRFSQRGLVAVDTEWKLQTTAHNLLKLWRHRQHALT